MVRKPSRRQIRPARVYQTVTTLMDHRVQPTLKVPQPIWYKVVESIPPSEMVTRPFPPQHKPANPKTKKASRLFQPQHLKYPEDGLREQFYKEHPWELARPRMIIETDGKDHLRCDWSKGIQQPGIPLTGESVVQRQMWLMNQVFTKPDPDQPGEVVEYRLGRAQAYDQARREFYRLRQEEQIERRIAQEEARMVGAYFGQTHLQVGMGLEDEQFEKWKKWAGKEINLIRSEQAEANNALTEDADMEDGTDELDRVREALERL